MLWKQRSCLPPGKSSIHSTRINSTEIHVPSTLKCIPVKNQYIFLHILIQWRPCNWLKCLLGGAGNDNIFMVGFLSYTSLNCKFCRAAKYKRNPRKECVPWRPEGLLLHFASCHLDRGRHSTASCTAPCTMGVSGKFSLSKVLSLSTKRLLVLKAVCLFWESLEKIF